MKVYGRPVETMKVYYSPRGITDLGDGYEWVEWKSLTDEEKDFVLVQRALSGYPDPKGFRDQLDRGGECEWLAL